MTSLRTAFDTPTKDPEVAGGTGDWIERARPLHQIFLKVAESSPVITPPPEKSVPWLFSSPSVPVRATRPVALRRLFTVPSVRGT